MVALDFLVDAINRGEIEVGKMRDDGHRELSVANTATQRLAELIKHYGIQERIDEHGYVDWLPSEEKWIFKDAERITKLNALKDKEQS